MRIYFKEGGWFIVNKTLAGYEYVVVFPGGFEVKSSKPDFDTREEAEQAAVEYIKAYYPDEEDPLSD